MGQTRSFRFRLYPTQNQQKILQNNLSVCRWVYNKMVEKINKEGRHSRNDLNYFLTELKEQEPWLYSCHSKMLQMISTQLYGAQKALIQLHQNGYKTGNLKFAKYSNYNIFTYNQSGFKIINGFLHLTKIGKLKIIQHRQIPENSEIKQITISKSKSGKWHACVVFDMTCVMLKINIGKSAGIDVGIKNFAYDSDGFSTPNPLNLKKILKPLAKVQRKIARRQSIF